MCSRVCGSLSKAASYVWTNFLAKDCQFLANKVAVVWEVMRFKQPDPNANRTYTPLNGAPMILSKITKLDEIVFQLEVSEETQNWSKRWVRALFTTGSVGYFLLNPSFYGAISTGAATYLVVKFLNKGIDLWHAGTEEFNTQRLSTEYTRLVAAAPAPAAAPVAVAAAAAAHAGPPA